MSKISFIVPVYNCKAYLHDCISSIQSSGVPDYEILLIDDGSTDGSGALCDGLAARFPEIITIHQTNAGVSAARNTGIRNSHGDYLFFIDADDTIEPLDTSLLQYLQENVDVVIFGMKFRYFHKDQLIREEVFSAVQEMDNSLVSVAHAFSVLFCQNYFSPVWNKIIKKSVICEHSILFNTELTNYEDLEFSLRVLSQCRSIAVTPAVYYLYRVNYDHDKTVDRVARIPDILGNTDLLAAAFFEFERNAIAAGAKKPLSVKACLLNIYFELFSVKMKTAPFSSIAHYCKDFNSNPYVNLCLQETAPSGLNLMWYKWIRKENSLSIWLYVRYLRLRHYCARNIKRMIGWYQK